MKPNLALALLCTAACSPEVAYAPEASGLAFTENVMPVPGFADFLLVDAQTVWTTNNGRIEQWSTSGKVASVEIAKPCGTMAMEAGSLWVGNCEGGEVFRVDPRTAQLVAAIPAGIGPSGEQNIVAGAGSVWAPNQASGQISRIDPATNTITASIDVALGTTYLAFGYEALWAVSGTSGTIHRIDPVTNSITHTTSLGQMPGFLAAGEGAVWVQEQGDGTVARIDPSTAQVTGRVKVGENLKWGDIDTGGGKVWLRTTDDQTFVVIDARSQEILARLGKPEGSGALRYTPRGIWTSAHDVQTLTWWTAVEAEAQ